MPIRSALSDGTVGQPPRATMLEYSEIAACRAPMICGDMVGIEVRTSAALTDAVSKPSDHSEPPLCCSTSPIGS